MGRREALHQGRQARFLPVDQVLWHRSASCSVGFVRPNRYVRYQNVRRSKAKGLVTEITNGRLAMIGIMGFVAAAKVPGSVPALAGVVKPYAGEVMGVFSAADASLPFVSAMVKYPFF